MSVSDDFDANEALLAVCNKPKISVDDIKKMRVLIEHERANVNTPGHDQWQSPLHGAVASGSGEAVKLLLENKANIEGTNRFGATALIMAAKYGHHTILNTLVSGGANRDAVDRDGDSAYIKAAMRGDIKSATMLLANGANPLISSKKGYKAIDYVRNSRYREKSEVVRFFQTHDTKAAQEQKQCNNQLIVLCCDKEPLTPEKLHTARRLVATSWAFDDTFHDALPLAAQHGHVDVVDMLLTQRKTTKAAEQSATHDAVGLAMDLACQYNQHDVIKAIAKYDKKSVEGRAGRFGTDKTPLLTAITYHNQEAVDTLLACGANAKSQTTRGATPLSKAAGVGDLNIVNALITAGADVNKGRPSPLVQAAKCGHCDVANRLIEQGADIKVCVEDRILTKSQLMARYNNEPVANAMYEKVNSKEHRPVRERSSLRGVLAEINGRQPSGQPLTRKSIKEMVEERRLIATEPFRA